MRFVIMALLLAVVVMASCASCSGAKQKPEDLNKLMGKDRDYVEQVMGRPEGEAHCDTTILEPGKYTQAEIDQWRNSTTSYGLDYKDVSIWFNMNGKVMGIEPVP